ncbi:MAG: HAD-IA family hydrolase [Alistipes sp.]|jgi:phosphoglycolate phosphatase|nr:HAD-IA family hydrolase [Alistipes sp.]
MATNIKNIKCVLLDFDGTTADTSQSIIHCVNRVLEPLGVVADPAKVARITGYALHDVFRFLIEDGDKALIEQCVQSYSRFYASEGLGMITLFPHVLDTLSRLHTYGIKTAIATNNLSPVINDVAGRLDMHRCLDEIVCIDQVAKGKPAPDIALEAMRRLDCTPEETLMVGDSILDIQMGIAAACHTCGVTYGSNPRNVLAEAGAEYLVDDFAEIANIILNK